MVKASYHLIDHHLFFFFFECAQFIVTLGSAYNIDAMLLSCLPNSEFEHSHIQLVYHFGLAHQNSSVGDR